jgi:hypothetical protein
VFTSTLINRICADRSAGTREGSEKCFEVFMASIVTLCPREAKDLPRLNVAIEPPSLGGYGNLLAI